MTVESIVNRANYIALPGDSSYDFSFKYFRETDITIYVDSVLLTTGYTVTPNVSGSSFGGTVTLTTPMVGGEKFVIKRKLPNTQETDYEENDDFPSQVAEDDYDRAAMRDQDQQEILDRCWKVGEASTVVDTVISDPTMDAVGKALIIAEGEAPDTYKVVYSEENISDIVDAVKQDAIDAANSAATAEIDADRAEVAVGALFQRANPPFTLVDGQSDYTLTYPVNTIERNAAVFIDGVFQENTATNYIFPDEYTIRFVGAIPSGSSAQVLTSLSASNPDLTQAVQDTIDFQDASLVRDNVSKELKAIFADEVQVYDVAGAETDLSNLTIQRAKIEWTLHAASNFSDVVFPLETEYVFYIYPNGNTLSLAALYENDGNLQDPDPTARKIRMVIDYDGVAKTILNIQNLGV